MNSFMGESIIPYPRLVDALLDRNHGGLAAYIEYGHCLNSVGVGLCANKGTTVSYSCTCQARLLIHPVRKLNSDDGDETISWYIDVDESRKMLERCPVSNPKRHIPSGIADVLRYTIVMYQVGKYPGVNRFFWNQDDNEARADVIRLLGARAEVSRDNTAGDILTNVRGHLRVETDVWTEICAQFANHQSVKRCWEATLRAETGQARGMGSVSLGSIGIEIERRGNVVALDLRKFYARRFRAVSQGVKLLATTMKEFLADPLSESDLLTRLDSSAAPGVSGTPNADLNATPSPVTEQMTSCTPTVQPGSGRLPPSSPHGPPYDTWGFLPIPYDNGYGPMSYMRAPISAPDDTALGLTVQIPGGLASNSVFVDSLSTSKSAARPLINFPFEVSNQELLPLPGIIDEVAFKKNALFGPKEYNSN